MTLSVTDQKAFDQWVDEEIEKSMGGSAKVWRATCKSGVDSRPVHHTPVRNDR